MRTYRVHYGNTELARCDVLPTKFRKFYRAEWAAWDLTKNYENVVIVDSDGNQLDMKERAAESDRKVREGMRRISEEFFGPPPTRH